MEQPWVLLGDEQLVRPRPHAGCAVLGCGSLSAPSAPEAGGGGASLLSHGVGVGDCEKLNLFQVRKGSWFSFFSPMVGSFVPLL